MSGLEWTTGCGKEGGKRVHLLKKGGALGSGQEVSWLPALVNGLQQWNDTVYHVLLHAVHQLETLLANTVQDL